MQSLAQELELRKFFQQNISSACYSNLYFFKIVQDGTTSSGAGV
jgi:hypothetical protein